MIERRDHVVAVGPSGVDVILDGGCLAGQAPELLGLFEGGCVRNFAVDLAVLGARTFFFSQQPTSGVHSVPSLTCRTVDQREGGACWRGAMVGFLGRNGELRQCSSDYAGAEGLFNSKCLDFTLPEVTTASLFTTSSDVSYDFWMKAVETLGRSRCCLITAGLPLPPDYLNWLKRAGIAFMNEEECGALGLEAPDLLAQLAVAGVQWCFVTAGAKGVYYLSSEGEVVKSRPLSERVQPKCTVGCGDAFAAAVVSKWLRDEPVEIAVAKGVEVASVVARRIGNDLQVSCSVGECDGLG